MTTLRRVFKSMVIGWLLVVILVTAVNAQVTVTVPLHPYFNWVSFAVVPPNLNAAAVFGPIENLELAFDCDGGIFIPPFMNTIGLVDLPETYQLFVRTWSMWEVTGTPMDPNTVYHLDVGWTSCGVGYPFPFEVPVEIAVTEIEDVLEIVIFDQGGFYIPRLGINCMGNMIPGKAYMMYGSQEQDFTYHAEALSASPVHDYWEIPPITGAPQPTGIPHALLLRFTKDAAALNPSIIEIYDENCLVGKSNVLSDRHLTPMTVWGESSEPQLVGYRMENPLRFIVYAADGSILPLAPEPEEVVFNDETAFNDVTLDVIKVIPDQFNVEEAYPNPFNSTVRANFTLPQPGGVSFRIMNILGQQVAAFTSVYPSGNHTFHFDAKSGGRQIVSGIYFLQIRYLDHLDIQKVVYLR